MRFGFAIGIWLALFGATTVASGQESVAPANAALLANNCFTCHGPNGRSPGGMPSLHTLSANEIAARLKQFKSGERPSTVMTRHAKGYSEAELDALAKYIASLNKMQ